MTKGPLLSELREPPVVGRFYMVPVVRNFSYCGKTDIWPVLGPLHQDAEFFAFKDVHYHVDIRFLTRRQEQALVAFGNSFGGRGAFYRNKSTAFMAASFPLANMYQALPKGRPRLARRRCRSTEWSYPLGFRPEIQRVREAYGDPAGPIRKPDGRLLCPHRKVDLSTFAPDADGIVTCPLHGLRVRCGVPS